MKNKLSVGPRLVPVASTRQDVSQTLKTVTEQARYWDEKLNKPKPLAPSTLRDTITEDDYTTANVLFGNFVDRYMEREMEELLHHREASAQILHFGVGEGFDLGYFEAAVKSGFVPTAFDFSEVARNNGQNRLRHLFKSEALPDGRQVNQVVQFGEMEEICTNSLNERVKIVQASRLLQFLSPEHLERILKRVGGWLRHHETRFVIVHPFPENNRQIKFTTTVPYSLHTIQEGLTQGAKNKEIQLVRAEENSYFDQTYTAGTLMMAA